MEKEESLFIESQRFNQIWLLALIFAIDAGVMFNFVKQYFDSSVDDLRNQLMGFLPTFICLVISVFIYSLRLNTMINSEGISVRFLPIQRKYKFYTWDQIAHVAVRQYKPLLEYRGWGYRMTYSNGVAYSVSGNQGIQIVTKDGKKILIGTQKPHEATEVLKKFI